MKHGNQKWPGSTQLERNAHSAAFQNYLKRIHYPLEERQEDNPIFIKLREDWLVQRQMRLATLKAKRELKEVESQKQNKANSIPGRGAQNTTKQQAQQAVKRSKGAFNSKHPPPTGFHSNLSVYKWLLHYIPHHFSGESNTNFDLKETIFDIIRDFNKGLQDKTLPSPQQIIANTNKVKVDLYKIQKRMLEHFMKYAWAAVEVFRSAGKTQLVLGLITYIICENPDIRIAFMSEEYKKTAQRVRVVRALLQSPKIVEDYGYLINDTHSSSGKGGKNTEALFECHRTASHIEPTLMAITWKDAQALGYHYDGVVMDDPWSQKLQNTTDAIEKWLDWFGEFRFSMENVKFCWMLRTKKGYHDLYTELDKMSRWKIMRQPLVMKLPVETDYEFIEDSEGVIVDVRIKSSAEYEIYDTCNGKYNISNILLIRHENPYYYERELQNNPYLQEGNVFKVGDLNNFNSKSLDPIVQGFLKQQSAVKYIKMMDMSFGQSDTADYNVLLVLGKYRNRIFLVDAAIGRWSFADREKEIKRMEERWPGVPLYIEQDFMQNAVIKELRGKLKGLKIHGFTSKGKGQNYKDLYEGQKKASKKGKIHDSLIVPVSDQRVYIAESLPGRETLINQFRSFPNCDYFDYIDTLSMGNIVLGTTKFHKSAVFA